MSNVPPPPNPSSPDAPNYFGDNPYAAPRPADYGSGLRRGLVNQVRVVAILNLVQAGLELFLALMTGINVLVFSVMDESIFARNANMSGEEQKSFFDMRSYFLVIFGVVTAVLIVTAALRIWAGIANCMFLKRRLGIISLSLGLASVFTIYCSITSIGVAIYGLIVLLNPEVKEAFEMRAKGMKSDEILRLFNTRPA